MTTCKRFYLLLNESTSCITRRLWFASLAGPHGEVVSLNLILGSTPNACLLPPEYSNALKCFTRTTQKLSFPSGSGCRVFASYTRNRFLSFLTFQWSCVGQRQTMELCTSETPASVRTPKRTKWWPRDTFLRQNTSPQEKKKCGQALYVSPSNASLFLTFLPAAVTSFVTKITCL